jgi:dihydroorotate dehydrogenase electron transfer subunit
MHKPPPGRVKKLDMKYRILQNERIKGNAFRMALEIPRDAPMPLPGQFYNIRCSQGTDPLLRRPLSVHRFRKERDHLRLEILYRVIGKGTQWLSQREKGEDLDTLGPLGNGFRMDPALDDIVLVAGGIGIAPLYAVGDETVKAGPAARVTVVLGVRTQAEILYETECRRLGEIFFATDDGSHGFKGTATELLVDLLRRNRLSATASFYGCGPKAMLKELAKVSERFGLSLQVTLEEHMGCGFGACLSCAFPLKPSAVNKDKQWPKPFLQWDENGEKLYSLICKDGPVFDSKEVDWDEWLA